MSRRQCMKGRTYRRKARSALMWLFGRTRPHNYGSPFYDWYNTCNYSKRSKVMQLYAKHVRAYFKKRVL